MAFKLNSIEAIDETALLFEGELLKLKIDCVPAIFRFNLSITAGGRRLAPLELCPLVFCSLSLGLLLLLALGLLLLAVGILRLPAPKQEEGATGSLPRPPGRSQLLPHVLSCPMIVVWVFFGIFLPQERGAAV